MITEATRPAARRGDTPGAPATSVTPSTSVALPATAPSPVTAALEPLRDLPGLAHACLLDEGGHVLAEIGTDGGTAGAVLAWGGRADGVASDRGLALEDVIVTSDAAHHLLRAVDGAPSRGSWVYLRVDRERGNLALARRRLAAVAVPAGGTAHPGRTPARPAVHAPAGRRSGPGARGDPAAGRRAGGTLGTAEGTPDGRHVPPSRAGALDPGRGTRGRTGGDRRPAHLVAHPGTGSVAGRGGHRPARTAGAPSPGRAGTHDPAGGTRPTGRPRAPALTTRRTAPVCSPSDGAPIPRRCVVSWRACSAWDAAHRRPEHHRTVRHRPFPAARPRPPLPLPRPRSGPRYGGNP